MNEDIPAASATTSAAPRPSLHRDPSSQAPRGILKKADDDGPVSPPAGAVAQGQGQEGAVHWDEVNLSLNDVNRDSTMRITEPKTPYVRYNAETDEVMDLDKIPGFELGQTDHQATTGSTTATEAEGSTSRPSGSSRSSSFSGSRRGSESSRRSSDVGERKMVVVEDHGPGVDAEDEGQDEETRAARKQFKQRRNSHYEGEGEVMKRFKARAAAKASEDDDEDEAMPSTSNGDQAMSSSNNNTESAIDDEDDDGDIVGEEARRNARANSQINGNSGQYGRSMPPVPPIPNGYN